MGQYSTNLLHKPAQRAGRGTPASQGPAMSRVNALKLATLETFENLGRATRQTPLAHERDVARQSPTAQGSLSKKR